MVDERQPFSECKCTDGSPGLWDPFLGKCVPNDEVPESGGTSGEVVIYHIRDVL